jgi:hypothetical protein
MKKGEGWWSRNFLQAELLLSIAFTVCFVAWSEIAGYRSVVIDILAGNRGPLYGALISLHGALLGFVIATVAIVIGLVGHERLAVLQASAQYETLWRVFTSSARALGVAAGCALLGLLFDRDSHPSGWVFYAVVGTSVLAFFRLWRCIWALEAIISIVVAKSQENKR